MPDEHTPASLSGTAFVADVDAWARKHDLWPSRGPILVGVSGGIDSMVLLHALHAVFASVPDASGEAARLVAAHVNYGLRPGADDDEALVRRVCAALTPPVPLMVRHVDLGRRREEEAVEKTSLQAQARDVRYSFFAEQARTHGARAVAVGHHRQDQAETLLLRLFRGAGPEALAGMRPKRPLQRDQSVHLIRPLLQTQSDRIRRVAAEHKIPWRDDPSNTSGPYARASLRTAILPAIETEFPGATGRIAHAATLLREVTDTTLRPERLKRQAQVVAAWQNEDSGDGNWAPGSDLARSRLASVLLDADALRDAPRVWRERIILDALGAAAPDAPQTAGMAHAVAELINAQTGRHVDVGSGTVWRERTGLRVVSVETKMFDPVPIRPGTRASTPEGTVTMRVFSPDPDPMDLLRAEGNSVGPATVFLDADVLLRDVHAPVVESSGDELETIRRALASGWVVRRWREGDRIQPLGMEGTKTVADVLTDAQVPPHVRPRVLVVAGPPGIAWIVGHRINHRFRLQPSTQHVVQFTWEKSAGRSPSLA